MQFLVKVILIDFKLDKYMKLKGKDVFIFFLAVLRSQRRNKKGTQYFQMNQRAYEVVFFTPTISIFCCLLH